MFIVPPNLLKDLFFYEESNLIRNLFQGRGWSVVTICVSLKIFLLFLFTIDSNYGRLTEQSLSPSFNLCYHFSSITSHQLTKPAHILLFRLYYAMGLRNTNFYLNKIKITSNYEHCLFRSEFWSGSWVTQLFSVCHWSINLMQTTKFGVIDR